MPKNFTLYTLRTLSDGILDNTILKRKSKCTCYFSYVKVLFLRIDNRSMKKKTEEYNKVEEKITTTTTTTTVLIRGHP